MTLTKLTPGARDDRRIPRSSRLSLARQVRCLLLGLTTLTGLSAGAAIAQDREGEGWRLQLWGDQSKYIDFGQDFVFPFGGLRHSGCYVHGNGYISFGGLGLRDRTPSVEEMLRRQDEFDYGGGIMRIAPAWADLDTVPGQILAGPAGDDGFQIGWYNTQVTGMPGSGITVILNLRQDGSFSFYYPQGVTSPGTELVVGFSAGEANLDGEPLPQDLSGFDGYIGTGTESAIFEYFPPWAFDIDGDKLEFAPVLPHSGLLSLSSNDAIEVDLGFRFPFYGNEYSSVWIGSNGDLNLTEWSPFYFTQTDSSILEDTARIIPLGADFNPVQRGSIRVDYGPGGFSVLWEDLPESETDNSNTFSVTLRPDGSIQFDYGQVDAPTSWLSKAIVGVTGGWPVTTGLEQPIHFQGGNRYGSGQEAAIYEVCEDPSQFDLSHQSISFNPFTRPSGLPLMNNSSHRYRLPDGFTFPFGGVRYRELYINSNGTLTFGSRDADVTESASELLGHFPRLAVLWDSFGPKSMFPPVEGSISVDQGADTLTVHYSVPELNFGAEPNVNEFSVTLNRDGSFHYDYGRVDSQDSIVGYSTGGTRTSGGERWTDLSWAPLMNEGSETAVFEPFWAYEKPFDLEGATLHWSRVKSTLWRCLPSIGGNAEMLLDAGREHGGELYVVGLAYGSEIGIPLPDGRRIPLNPDPLLGATAGADNAALGNFAGFLNQDGVAYDPYLTLPYLPSIVGINLTSAWVTLDPTAPWGIGYISEPTAFAIGPLLAVTTPCTMSVVTSLVQNTAVAVTVTITDGAGNPVAGELVGAWLYDYAVSGTQPHSALGFKVTDGNGQVVFNSNAAAGMARAKVKVISSGQCGTMRQLQTIK